MSHKEFLKLKVTIRWSRSPQRLVSHFPAFQDCMGIVWLWMKTRRWCRLNPRPRTVVAPFVLLGEVVRAAVLEHVELLYTLPKEPCPVLEICCVDVELMLLWPDAPSLRTHITSFRDWFKLDCVGGRNPSYLCPQTALINSSGEFTPGPPVLWGIYECDAVSWCRYPFRWWECDSFFFNIFCMDGM